MRLNKGSAPSQMASWARQSANRPAYEEAAQEANGAGFQDAMLKLLNHTPATVLQISAGGEGAGMPAPIMLKLSVLVGGTRTLAGNLLLMLDTE